MSFRVNGLAYVLALSAAALGACGEVAAKKPDAGATPDTPDGPTITITNIMSSATGAKTVNDVITIDVSTNVPLAVTGAPSIGLSSGGMATYTSGSGTTALVFTYTVAAGQESADLDVVPDSVSLNGGALRDAMGREITLVFPAAGAAGSLASNEDIVVDAVAPTITGLTTTATGRQRAGTTLTIAVAFSEAVTVTGTPTLSLNSGGFASYSTGSGTNTLSFTYTVAQGEMAADLDASSVGALMSGTIKDVVNDAVRTVPVGATAGSLAANAAVQVDTSTNFDPNFSSAAGGVFAGGGLMISSTGTTTVNMRTVLGKSSGKYYWELTATAGAAATNGGGIGFATSAWPSTAGYTGALEASFGFGYGGLANNQYWMVWAGATISGVPPAGEDINNGTVYMFAVDLDTDKGWVGHGGVWHNGGNPAAGTAPVITGIAGTVYPTVTFYANSPNAFTANFGGSAFTYTVPTGFSPGFF